MYDIAIWSASDRRYIDFIISLFPPEIKPVLILDAKRCVKKTISMAGEFNGERIVIKPLAKIWNRKTLPYNRYNTIVIDNIHTTVIRNYGNAIITKDYIGQEEDDELLKILDILNKVVDEPNVRQGLFKIRQGLI
jgi:TFIIF-interacting CTD phosphatase-like protein